MCLGGNSACWNTVLEQFREAFEWNLIQKNQFSVSSGLGLMSSANDYRRYAAECLALAERLSDSADKARLVQMAQAFLDLANKQERTDSPPSED